MTPPSRTHEEARLNPFPFAAEMYFRFGFLLLIALSVTISAGFLVMFAFVDAFGPIEECMKGIIPRHNLTPQTFLEIRPEAVRGVFHDFGTCLETMPMGTLLFWPGMLVVALTIGSGVLALLDGHRKVRSKHLQTMPAQLEATLTPRIERIAKEIGIAQLPRLFISTLQGDANAFVFIHKGRQALALSNGLVVTALTLQRHLFLTR